MKMLIKNKLIILFSYILVVIILNCRDSDNNFFQKNSEIDNKRGVSESKQKKAPIWEKVPEAMSKLFIGTWCGLRFNKEVLNEKEDRAFSFEKKEKCNENENTILKIKSINK